jgi:multiple sugar transport system permease protein
MPAVVTPVITGTLFVGLFDPRHGLINYLLAATGLIGPDWLLDPHYAMYAVMLISLWGVGGGMIIYLSGLQSISTELYEAADLDGASKGQRLWSITLPLMSPIIFYNLVVGIIGTFQLFTQIWVLTKGGPDNSTEVFNIYLYKTAFEYQSMGYASAQAWVLFVLILGLTALVFRSSSQWVYYENEVQE